jgi:regulator of nucleoside diphosphate kinase
MMHDHILPEIQLTRRDFGHLDQLTAMQASPESLRVVDFLVRELSRARIVDAGEIGPDVVTMYSEVLFRDVESGRERTVTLVYPREHALHEGALSVLTPLGAALIGLKEGHSIAFETVDGRSRRVQVVRVLSQPDSNRRSQPDSHGHAAAQP